MVTVCGQCIGAGRKDEAVYYIKKLCMIAEVILIISCLSVFVLTKPITILGGMEKESADMCIHMTMWITIVKPLVWIMAFIPGYGMRAAGDVKFSMLTSCTTMWLCRFCLSSIYDPDSWCRSDGRVDRNVFRLDTPWDYFFVEIPQQKVAEASGDLKFLHRFYMADPLDFTYLC